MPIPLNYQPVEWINDETPLNQTNMNHLEEGLKAVSDALDSYFNIEDVEIG